jgi:hypothetical protein
MKRRDFLAGVGVTALGFPFMAACSRAAAPEAAPEGAQIARLAIYPAIGISRVGGSAQYFLAPETPGLPPRPDGGFKDGDQLIKKQVQRFRIYAFDDQGRVISEVTSQTARISWSVHVANTKAAWYGFNNPLDEGEVAPGLPGQKRNPYFVSDQQREAMLVIDGGETAISGADTNSGGTDAQYAMGGVFYGVEPVGLGHLQTDDQGRLMVFPPDGVSNSPVNAAITSFADNDGWHDDWCDGPVSASVEIDGYGVIEADQAWVACVGPNFAPEIAPVSTLYDVIQDMNVKAGWAEPPETVYFRRDIYPTFQRLGLMKWITEAALLREGWLDVGDFTDPGYIARLADPGPASQALRQSVFGQIRNPYNQSDEAYIEERLKMPYMMGHGVNYDGSPLQWFQFPHLQYDLLARWAAGDFVNDWDDADAAVIETLDDMPLTLQPQALTQAALEPCSGGAFHPGVELTYYLRHPAMYAKNADASVEPFRIARGDRPSLIQNIGRLLTPEKAMQGGNGAGAPIGPQMPGDLTRWMGLPWQCDAFSCQTVRMQENFPTATWWPALLPIDVLPEDYYEALQRTDLTPDQRTQFFNSRVAWSRDVAGIGYHADGSYWDGITNMIALWQRMGFVVRRPGATDGAAPPALARDMFVEAGRSNMELMFNWTPSDGVLPEQ